MTVDLGVSLSPPLFDGLKRCAVDALEPASTREPDEVLRVAPVGVADGERVEHGALVEVTVAHVNALLQRPSNAAAAQ